MLRALLAAVLMLGLVAPAASGAPAPWAEDKVLSAVVRDLCTRRVALLAEADHWDGRTIEFKVSLIQRLVERCGYDAVFFEASNYDLLELSSRLRRGEPVSAAHLNSGIGGLWNKSADFAPLIPFLFEKMKSGRLVVGGIDDNLGSAGAFYSIAEMPAELTAYLTAARAAACREGLRKRIYFSYPESAPYDEAERAALLACVGEIRSAVTAEAASDRREERLQMVRNLERYVSRDLASDAEQHRRRDHSMFLNFRWLADRLPLGSRIIVWGATVHTARDATASPTFAGVENFGSHMDRAYGTRAFSLGFSATSGAAGFGGKTVLPAPAPGSLEARAAAGAGEAVYFGRRDLAKLGVAPGAAFFHEYQTTRWSRVLDGLVVFREERPPTPLP